MNNNQKILKVIENFTFICREPSKQHKSQDTYIDVFSFFGNYRLVSMRNTMFQSYVLYLDGEDKLNIEKNLDGSIQVKRQRTMTIEKIKEMLIPEKLAKI